MNPESLAKFKESAAQLKAHLANFIDDMELPDDPGNRGDEVSVREPLSVGAAPGRPFWNDCYARAMGYILDHPDVPGIELVHGTMGDLGPGRRGRTGHAWVEIPHARTDRGPTTVVFDGVAGRFYELASYLTAMDAEIVARYDIVGAVALMVEGDFDAPPVGWHRPPR
jgi:hypothetical protein